MRTWLRGKVTLLFMVLGMLIAIPAVALAAELVTSELDTVTPNAVTVEQGGTTNFTIGLTATGNIASTITSANPSTATVDTAYSLNNTGAVSGSTPSSAFKFYSSGTGCTGGGTSNCDVTWTGAPTPYSVGASVSAASTTPVGDYSLVLSDSANTTDLTNPNVSGGKLGDTTATTITVHVVAASAPDADADGVPDASDNCPNVPNADQADSDVDGIGDLCDPTPNGDNVAPEIAPDHASVTVDEGQIATNTGTWSDANAGDTVTLVASVGNVIKNDDGTWSWSYDTTDGPDNGQTVTIIATDDEGASSSTVFSLTVNNVAPTVAFTAGPTSVDEGATEHTYSYSISDPGQDTVQSVSTSCGTGGTKVSGSDTNTNTSGSFKCVFADGPLSPNPDVTVQATDSDGAAGNTATRTVQVNNVAPNVTGLSDRTLNEGTSTSFNLGSFTDPGDDDPWTATVNWGDGSGSESLDSFNSPGSLGTRSHTYADNGTYTVTVTVTEDGSGAPSGSATFTATVLNVDPVITNPLSLNGATGTACLSGNTVTLNSVSFTDAGTADTHTGTVEWGDANDNSDVQTLNINQGNGSGSTNSLQHTYDPGTYTLTVTITDDDGGHASRTASVSRLYNMSGILAPFNSTGDSVWKYGSTIPVKVKITDCNSNPVSGLAPKLGLSLANAATPGGTINETDIASTSGADDPNAPILRYSSTDGQYIYNLSTKYTAAFTDPNATYWATVKGLNTAGQTVTSPAQVSQKFGLKSK